MQNEAYKLTGAVAVTSALGFLLRWVQNITILDPETGLAESGRSISFVVAALIVLVAAAIGAAAYAVRKTKAASEPENALAGKTFLYTALCVFPGVLFLAAGALTLVGSWPEAEILIRRITGVTALAAGVGSILLASSLTKPEKASARRVCVVLLILFAAMWLVAEYKAISSDPVTWRFAVEILAICAALLAYYYVAGYFFGEPNPPLAVFFCFFGGFLCVMSAVDEHALAESLCFAAAAFQLFVWGYALVANLRRVEEELPKA